MTYFYPPPLPSPFNGALVAQWVKHWPIDLVVPGSSPPRGKIFSTVNRFCCTEPFSIIRPSSWYGWNTVDHKSSSHPPCLSSHEDIQGTPPTAFLSNPSEILHKCFRHIDDTAVPFDLAWAKSIIIWYNDRYRSKVSFSSIELLVPHFTDTQSLARDTL